MGQECCTASSDSYVEAKGDEPVAQQVFKDVAVSSDAAETESGKSLLPQSDETHGLDISGTWCLIDETSGKFIYELTQVGTSVKGTARAMSDSEVNGKKTSRRMTMKWGVEVDGTIEGLSFSWIQYENGEEIGRYRATCTPGGNELDATGILCNGHEIKYRGTKLSEVCTIPEGAREVLDVTPEGSLSAEDDVEVQISSNGAIVEDVVLVENNASASKVSPEAAPREQPINDSKTKNGTGLGTLNKHPKTPAEGSTPRKEPKEEKKKEAGPSKPPRKTSKEKGAEPLDTSPRMPLKPASAGYNKKAWNAMSQEERLEMSANLVKASSNGDVRKVKALIAKGVKVNSADSEGATAWKSAAKSGHTNCLEALWETGLVQVNDCNKYNGKCALHFACQYGHNDTVVWLVNVAGVDHSAKNIWGQTPAAMTKNPALAAWLELENPSAHDAPEF